MGTYLENSVSYISKNFPSLNIEEKDGFAVFSGRMYIAAQCRNPVFMIQVSPKICLKVKIDGSEIPSCTYLGNTCNYPHINKDKTLCVATDFDVKLQLKNSTCISDYVEKFLKPFFLSFEYWKKNQKPLFGERAHGTQGIIESIKEYTNSHKLTDKDVVLLLGWSANRAKFRKIIPKEKQTIFLSRYQNKLAKLRKLDSFFLWNLYEDIKKNMRTS